jgi:hypothetical protein
LLKTGFEHPLTRKLWAATGHAFVGRVIVALALVIIGWIEFVPAVRVILSPGGDVLGEVYEDFNDGAVTPPQRVEVAGFVPCGDGWCLMPGVKGTLIYRTYASDEVPTLNVWFYRPVQGSNDLSVSVDQGGSYKSVANNAVMVGTRLDTRIRVGPGQELWLKFEALNDSPNMALVVDELRIFYPTDDVPRLPVRRDVVIAFVVFGLAIVVLCRRWPLALSTLAILAVGVGLRYELLIPLVEAPLESDAFMYRFYSGFFSPFTDKGFLSAAFGVREPMFIFVAWLYAKMFGASDLGFRMMSVLLSVAAIWSVLRVARMLFGTVPGQVIGLLMAINAPLIVESVRFLRLELEIVLAMAYFAVALALLKRSPTVLLSAVALSLVGALLVSTRMTYLGVVLVLNAWFLARLAPIARLPLRERLRPWIAGMAVTAVILAAFVVPHRYNMYQRHGDAFYDLSKYSRWLANYEFTGRPGFPTRTELEQNGYLGPDITYGEYMAMYSRSEIINGTLRGYWKLFRRMEAAPRFAAIDEAWRARIDAGFQMIAAAGLLLAVFVPGYRWIPLAFVLFESSAAFVYDRHLLAPYRHTYSALPLVLFAAALPLTMAWNYVGRWRTAGVSGAGTAAEKAACAESGDAEVTCSMVSVWPSVRSLFVEIVA